MNYFIVKFISGGEWQSHIWNYNHSVSKQWLISFRIASIWKIIQANFERTKKLGYDQNESETHIFKTSPRYMSILRYVMSYTLYFISYSLVLSIYNWIVFGEYFRIWIPLVYCRIAEERTTPNPLIVFVLYFFIATLFTLLRTSHIHESISLHDFISRYTSCSLHTMQQRVNWFVYVANCVIL